MLTDTCHHGSPALTNFPKAHMTVPSHLPLHAMSADWQLNVHPAIWPSNALALANRLNAASTGMIESQCSKWAALQVACRLQAADCSPGDRTAAVLAQQCCKSAARSILGQPNNGTRLLWQTQWRCTADAEQQIPRPWEGTLGVRWWGILVQAVEREDSTALAVGGTAVGDTVCLVVGPQAGQGMEGWVAVGTRAALAVVLPLRRLCGGDECAVALVRRHIRRPRPASIHKQHTPFLDMRYAAGMTVQERLQPAMHTATNRQACLKTKWQLH